MRCRPFCTAPPNSGSASQICMPDKLAQLPGSSLAGHRVDLTTCE
jgi:hypothetical protein